MDQGRYRIPRGTSPENAEDASPKDGPALSEVVNDDNDGETGPNADVQSADPKHGITSKESRLSSNE
jgi:hypothetical protein